MANPNTSTLITPLSVSIGCRNTIVDGGQRILKLLLSGHLMHHLGASLFRGRIAPARYHKSGEVDLTLVI